MGRVITAPGVLTNVQGQIDHVTDMYDDIKNNNLKPLTITLDPVSNANGAVSVVTEDPRVTEDMKPISIEVGTPEVFKAPITVTTAAGTVTLACDNATGTSTVKVTLVKTSPVEGGADYPPAVTSTEFDILADRIGSLEALDTTDQSSIVDAVNELVSAEATLNTKTDAVTSTASSIADLVASISGNGVRTFYYENSSSLSDYPSVLTSLGATNRPYITIKKYSAIAEIDITAILTNGHPVSITGFKVNTSYYWSDTLDTLNSKFTVKTYTATLTANNNVSPFTALASILINDDVINYGDVVSIVIINGGSAAKPMATKLSSTQKTCYVYGTGIDESVTVRIVFMRT